MTTTFQPGYACTLTVGTGDLLIGPLAANYSSDYGPAELTKPVIGAKAGFAVAGQASGTFTIDGHTTEENIAAIQALRDPANQPFDIELTFNATGDKEAFAGVGRVSVTLAGDGEVDFSISGTIDGEVTFTAGT